MADTKFQITQGSPNQKFILLVSISRGSCHSELTYCHQPRSLLLLAPSMQYDWYQNAQCTQPRIVVNYAMQCVLWWHGVSWWALKRHCYIVLPVCCCYDNLSGGFPSYLDPRVDQNQKKVTKFCFHMKVYDFVNFLHPNLKF